MRNPNERKCRSILVALDGSEHAEHALPAALTLARRHDAVLHLIRVYVPLAGVYGEHALRYDEALDRELMKRAGDYLDEVVSRLAAAAGIRASSVLLEGPVTDTISRHAAAVGADLLVMTTQGRGPLARFWLGSVSDELVRQADIPLLLIRPQAAAPDLSREPGFGRVLIPLDGSPLAERVLEPVLALDTARQGEYTLLRVVMPMAHLNYGSTVGAYAGLRNALEQMKEFDQSDLKRAHEYLDQLAAHLRARSFRVNTRVSVKDPPATAILEDASVHDADLIVLATRCRGGLKRLMLGSVADKVLRGADCAVLVYRPVDSQSDSDAQASAARE
jgi:nucleotide-binding universal stress UspA family protein